MRESVILGMDQRREPQEKEGTKQMKFDMHCHTKEGSMDGKVPIDDFIAELIRKGFDGDVYKRQLYTLTGIEAFQEIKLIHHSHLIPLLQGIGEA